MATSLLQQRWRDATARERLSVMVMLLVVLGALLVTLLVLPALRVVRSAPATLATLDTKVLAMRAQAADLRAAPAVTPVAISAPVSAERELAGAGATVSEARDSAAGNTTTTVNLKSVEGAKLAAWLAKPEVQKQLLRLSLTRDAATGRVTGSAVLRAPG